MCGIAGWLSPAGEVERETLDAMREALAHRGPDGAGTWIALDRRVGLAHRRLAIVDLSPDADQPMHAEHGGRRASIVFNGEIYNHRELRRELEARGHRFRTDHADTEVLLAGFLHWGLDALLERLVGMFAFALWDDESRRLFLVRDRVGIKPLYVARFGADLAFASEAKALFRHPSIRAELCTESLRPFLAFRAVPAPRTLFRGVEQVGPGELLEVAGSTVYRRTWWDPLANARSAPPSLAAARDELERLLDDAIRLRLESDVPVGLFLSGGVDSAFLLARMAPHVGRPSTFTVSYPGCDAYDESADAAALAHEAGARHHPVPLDGERFGAALAAVAWHQDEPIAAPVCAAVYRLSERARAAGVPVVLAGEGSDELFVGYTSWLRLRDAERWNARVPDLPGRPLRRVAALAGGAFFDWAAPQREILRRAAHGEPLFQGGSLDFGEAAQERLLGPAAGAATESTYDAAIAPLRRAFLERGDPRDHTGWMTYVDLRFRLPQLMLPRLDKMGMAFGVEGRVPFLDHRVVELVCGLPPAWRGGAGDEPKALFKSVAERSLAREFVHRKKRGFRAPVAEWKDGALGRRYLPALDTFAERTGLFERRALADLLGRSGDRLWFGLLNFALWYSLYVDDVLGDVLPETRRPEPALVPAGAAA